MFVCSETKDVDYVQVYQQTLWTSWHWRCLLVLKLLLLLHDTLFISIFDISFLSACLLLRNSNRHNNQHQFISHKFYVRTINYVAYRKTNIWALISILMTILVVMTKTLTLNASKFIHINCSTTKPHLIFHLIVSMAKACKNWHDERNEKIEKKEEKKTRMQNIFCISNIFYGKIYIYIHPWFNVLWPSKHIVVISTFFVLNRK